MPTELDPIGYAYLTADRAARPKPPAEALAHAWEAWLAYIDAERAGCPTRAHAARPAPCGNGD